MAPGVKEEPPIRFVKRRGGWYPASDYDRQRSDAYAEGSVVDATLFGERSPRRHRFYFAALAIALENLREDLFFPNVEALRRHVLLALGYVSAHHIKDDVIEAQPLSMAWATMDDADFRPLLDRTLDYICAELCPGLAITAVKREATKLLGVTAKADAA